MYLKQIPALLQATYNQWSTDHCLRFGAAFAFYTFSSLIPLLPIVTCCCSVPRWPSSTLR